MCLIVERETVTNHALGVVANVTSVCTSRATPVADRVFFVSDSLTVFRWTVKLPRTTATFGHTKYRPRYKYQGGAPNRVFSAHCWSPPIVLPACTLMNDTIGRSCLASQSNTFMNAIANPWGPSLATYLCRTDRPPATLTSGEGPMSIT